MLRIKTLPLHSFFLFFFFFFYFIVISRSHWSTVPVLMNYPRAINGRGCSFATLLPRWKKFQQTRCSLTLEGSAVGVQWIESNLPAVRSLEDHVLIEQARIPRQPHLKDPKDRNHARLRVSEIQKFIIFHLIRISIIWHQFKINCWLKRWFKREFVMINVLANDYFLPWM